MVIMDDLQKERKVEDFTYNVAEHLYEMVIKTIKYNNKIGKRDIIYRVPLLTIGFPIYDVNTVTRIINGMLREDGFKTLVNGTRISVKW
jgi:hypothetical protein